MIDQLIFRGEEGYSALRSHILAAGYKKILLVCGRSLSKTAAGRFFDKLTAETAVEIVRFSGFSPNPDYDEAVSGVKLFRSSGCDAICGAGGGSAMDTAKCIKLFARMPDDTDYVLQEIVPNDIPLIAVPTTAGTGSETTRFAVIYYHGAKLSVTHESCIPGTVLLDSANLSSLPEHHRKCAMLDALCHAIESFWSVGSTDESRGLSRKAIGLIMDNMDGYLAGDQCSAANMLEAAFIAGQAINITATTAGHAMSYKLTSSYGLAHGHAAAVCVPVVYRFLLDNTGKCSDPRGVGYLSGILGEIPAMLGCPDKDAAVDMLSALPEKLGLAAPQYSSGDELDVLADSVNAGRLKNNPVIPDRSEIKEMYRRILRRN